MGIKQTDLKAFIEPESTGFLFDTARSFLKRHSNSELLLVQLKSLLHQGELETCRDLIQLIVREGHALADDSRTYLLRAQVAFETTESMGEVMAWVQQARFCKNKSKDLMEWEELMAGIAALNEGDYLLGEKILQKIAKAPSVSIIAQYKLAYHYFWRNIDLPKAKEMLEEITSLRPGFLKAWSTLGFIYNRMGQKVEAQQAFSHCLKHETCPERIEFYRQQLAS